MNVAHLLEALMLVCFGFSWPLNVIKAYKARTAKGMSLAFIILIITGYLAGIAAKFINGQTNYVLAVYFLNLVIVCMNIAVYVRNKALDRKRKLEPNKPFIQVENIVENIQVTQINENNGTKIIRMEKQDVELDKEDDMYVNYSNSLDEIINPERKSETEKNAVLLIGGTLARKIPVAELSKEFDFNFDIYNKSRDSLKVSEAYRYFKSEIEPLFPEAIIFQLGESDIAFFTTNPSQFDAFYLNLIEEVKKSNKKMRIALVSVENPHNNKTINEMNRHIKSIAESERCCFVNLENARLWNPKATKTSVDFAYENGLRIRKPLLNVAEILYSFAFNNIHADETENRVG